MRPLPLRPFRGCDAELHAMIQEHHATLQDLERLEQNLRDSETKAINETINVLTDLGYVELCENWKSIRRQRGMVSDNYDRMAKLACEYELAMAQRSRRRREKLADRIEPEGGSA